MANINYGHQLKGDNADLVVTALEAAPLLIDGSVGVLNLRVTNPLPRPVSLQMSFTKGGNHGDKVQSVDWSVASGILNLTANQVDAPLVATINIDPPIPDGGTAQFTVIGTEIL